MEIETEMALARLRAELDALRARIDAVEDEAADALDDGALVEAAAPGSGQWDLPDADACAAGFAEATRSVETVPSTGLRQIYKFAGDGYAVTAADLTGDPPPDPLPVFVMRMKVDADGTNALSVAYCTMATLIEALAGSSSSGGSDSGSDTSEPSPDGLPDGTEIWGKVEYDQTYNKFVQFKLVWSAATRTFVQAETPVDIITAVSHASQH